MTNVQSKIKLVTDTTFATEVLPSEKPVLVDFWAEWCGQCKRIAPVLEEIATEYADRLTVVTVDVDANPACMQDHAVLSLPTMLLFEGGREVKRITGAKTKATLVADLDAAL